MERIGFATCVCGLWKGIDLPGVDRQGRRIIDRLYEDISAKK
jgi:hypothetical protein